MHAHRRLMKKNPALHLFFKSHKQCCTHNPMFFFVGMHNPIKNGVFTPKNMLGVIFLVLAHPSSKVTTGLNTILLAIAVCSGLIFSPAAQRLLLGLVFNLAQIEYFRSLLQRNESDRSRGRQGGAPVSGVGTAVTHEDASSNTKHQVCFPLERF